MLTAIGGAGGNQWSISAGALPAGLSLASTGAITGTPAAAIGRILAAELNGGRLIKKLDVKRRLR